jgi:hypothetical protein
MSQDRLVRRLISAYGTRNNLLAAKIVPFLSESLSLNRVLGSVTTQHRNPRLFRWYQLTRQIVMAEMEASSYVR